MSGIGPRRIPYHWWGDAWATPNPKTLSELIDIRMITQSDADLLASHVKSGGSVIVGCGSSGGGKSTLAHALCEFVPASRTSIYVRGNQEMFDWIDDYAPTSLTLLVNEISAHLIAYAWGEVAKHVFRLTTAGAQLITTMHVKSLQELSSVLTASTIECNPTETSSLGLLVVLEKTRTRNSRLATISKIVDIRTGFPKSTA